MYETVETVSCITGLRNLKNAHVTAGQIIDRMYPTCAKNSTVFMEVFADSASLSVCLPDFFSNRQFLDRFPSNVMSEKVTSICSGILFLV
jgi:hypothetical protein